MRQFRCFDELRSTPPAYEGEVSYLSSWNDDGSFIGDGMFSGSLTPKNDDGIITASDGGNHHWSRIKNYILTPFDGGLTNDGSDASDILQKLINIAQARGVLAAGSTAGGVYVPKWALCRFTKELKMDMPISFYVDGALHFDSSTGNALSVGQSAGWATGYDIFIRNLFSNGGQFPSEVNDSGNNGIVVRNMVFSRLTVLSAYGFSNRAFYLDGTGNAGFKQVVQHNFMHLGQVVNNGVGLAALSADADGSSVQGNRIFVQNIYQNARNFILDDSTRFATASNTIDINAMDNCSIQGGEVNGRYNTITIGFAGTPGPSLKFGANSESNTVRFGNNFETDVTYQKGGLNNRVITSPPSPNQLPANGVSVVNGNINFNDYGVPVMVYGTISATGSCNVHVDVGPDTGHFGTVQKITTNGASGNIPFSVRVPTGGCWRLFIENGVEKVTLNAVSIHDAS